MSIDAFKSMAPNLLGSVQKRTNPFNAGMVPAIQPPAIKNIFSAPPMLDGGGMQKPMSVGGLNLKM